MKRRNLLSLRKIGFFSGLLCLSALTACGGFIDVGPLDESKGLPETFPVPPVEPRTVVVRLMNVSDNALNVQFFVSTDRETTTENQLFVEENAFRDGIGFLSMGILAADQTVEFHIDCSETLIIGTMGGEFLDTATGESIGQGTIARLAQLGPQFDCGDQVTFRFIPDEDGDPNALLSIQ